MLGVADLVADRAHFDDARALALTCREAFARCAPGIARRIARATICPREIDRAAYIFRHLFRVAQPVVVLSIFIRAHDLEAIAAIARDIPVDWVAYRLLREDPAVIRAVFAANPRFSSRFLLDYEYSAIVKRDDMSSEAREIVCRAVRARVCCDSRPSQRMMQLIADEAASIQAQPRIVLVFTLAMSCAILCALYSCVIVAIISDSFPHKIASAVCLAVLFAAIPWAIWVVKVASS